MSQGLLSIYTLILCLTQFSLCGPNNRVLPPKIRILRFFLSSFSDQNWDSFWCQWFRPTLSPEDCMHSRSNSRNQTFKTACTGMHNFHGISSFKIQNHRCSGKNNIKCLWSNHSSDPQNPLRWPRSNPSQSSLSNSIFKGSVYLIWSIQSSLYFFLIEQSNVCLPSHGSCLNSFRPAFEAPFKIRMATQPAHLVQSLDMTAR